jgi:hypothetical protein
MISSSVTLDSLCGLIVKHNRSFSSIVERARRICAGLSLVKAAKNVYEMPYFQDHGHALVIGSALVQPF